MIRPETYFVEAGSGPGVVCLHSNASTSAQWRHLTATLAPSFHVLAVDSYGAGGSPEWPSDRFITLSDEADLVEPVLSKAGLPFALVGHSYGAAVALIAALRNPDRVRAMALYEPTLFGLVDTEHARPNDADGIRNAVADAVIALQARDELGAAERFVDYWSGPGSWARMPANRQKIVAASTMNVGRWAHALFTEPTALSAFRSLEVPVLYMLGKCSTASALAVARILTSALPRVEVVEFDGLGHMGPLSHPNVVNEVVSEFLLRNHSVLGREQAQNGHMKRHTST
ncbi:alpha/beta fold hydrolase [Piscinibacter sp.]|jgi:pimeloyl-ACP methyl ester carboxylesterase|uniref:alpha/beta fold hydrolase n=1 Tax=Piscinibacter sp. TaxID=1903157 RepID=UPI003559B364